MLYVQPVVEPFVGTLTLLLGHTRATGLTVPGLYSGWHPLPSLLGPSWQQIDGVLGEVGSPARICWPCFPASR